MIYSCVLSIEYWHTLLHSISRSCRQGYRRNSLGDKPYDCRNLLLKWLGSLKPLVRDTGNRHRKMLRRGKVSSGTFKPLFDDAIDKRHSVCSAELVKVPERDTVFSGDF